MRHHIRAVLLDLDGVVVFTDKYHYLAWKKLADENGWAFDEQINHRLRGIPRMGSLEIILEHNKVAIPQDKKDALAAKKNDYYVEFLRKIGPQDIYPGVVEFLEKLKAEGVKLGLCSSSKNAKMVLDNLNLARLFDVVITGHDFKNAKPAPEIFLLASQKLRIPAFHCLVFEDAESGVQAALAGGMKCVGVGTIDLLPNAPELITDYSMIDVESLLDSGRPVRFPAEDWAITETAVRPKRLGYWETIFALSNGLLGMRGSFEEDDPMLEELAYPAMFVNGIYAYEAYHHIWKFPGFPDHRHALINVCDWRAINLFVDGEKFSMFSGKLADHRRTLDLRRGVLERSFNWTSPAGKRVSVKTTRLVSMVRRHSAAIRYEVTALDPCRIEIKSKVAVVVPCYQFDHPVTRTASQLEKDSTYCAVVETIVPDLKSTQNGPFEVAMAFNHQFDSGGLPAERKKQTHANTHETAFSADCPAGRKLTLTKQACFYSSIESPSASLAELAVSAVGKDAKEGFGAILAEQEKFWADYWDRADIVIEGNIRDQQAMRFTLFHLRQSNPEDDRRSISANATTGDKYCGHVFWDTESYISPHFIYCEPATVRSLLMYRYNILDRARERAKQMGGKGAMFSWNSISGEECGTVFEAATAEYHLQSDIAMAVWRYMQATGDEKFLHDYGAEIVFETARFMADRGTFIPYKDGKFCINAVCGPDEYGCAVNNNCYTNVMTQWHLRYACRLFDTMKSSAGEKFSALASRISLTDSDRRLWQKAAENMYIPFNKQLGIHEQDDSFLSLDPVDMDTIPKNTDIRELLHPLNLWRIQVAKQADVVLLMFTHGWQFQKKVKQANYEFYEPRTCHGSSLSACIHSIIGTEIGRHDDAYYYFRQSVLMDLNDFKNNTAGGVHSACLGGTWMAMVNGFAGMRDYGDNPGGPKESEKFGWLVFNPVLPKAWKSYSFKLVYRGRKLSVRVGGGKVEYRLIAGEPLAFQSANKMINLSPGSPTASQPVDD